MRRRFSFLTCLAFFRFGIQKSVREAMQGVIHLENVFLQLQADSKFPVCVKYGEFVAVLEFHT